MNDKPLWGGRFSKPPAPEMTVLGASIHFDQKLWPHEITATRAHAKALLRAGILDATEQKQIEAALDEAAKLFETGAFEFHPSDEDIHSAVERFLTQKLGPPGAKIHAGRSRNDLVVTDLRLWAKKTTAEIASGIIELQRALLNQAKEHAETLAPGYTHLQRAQPILLAHHLLAHCFALARDFQRMKSAHAAADVSPLGAAAFAGTSLPIDAQATAADLGFSATFDNSADAVSDRDFALEFLFAAAVNMVHISRLAEELVLWTSKEFAFATLDDAYATGSSIMPQKKNPDVAELSRAKTGRAIGNLTALLVTLKGLPLSYDRDLQEDKEPLFDSAQTLATVLPALTGAIQSLTFNKPRLEQSATEGGNAATDLAEHLVSKGLPFREAHETIGKLVAALSASGRDLTSATPEELTAAHSNLTPQAAALLNPRTSIESRTSHGGTAPLRVAEQLQKLDRLIGEETTWAASISG
jgi:argininosuccinate lyase